MDVTLIETNKGRKSIVCDGYRYRVDVELKSGEIAWRCTSKGCKARIRTDSSASMILQQKNPHNANGEVCRSRFTCTLGFKYQARTDM